MILGVISDTHVPDRVNSLHPALLDSLRQQGVSAILHAGDICAPQVLDVLHEVAPVHAVRGNRDWAFINRLEWSEECQFEDVNITLLHGHGNFRNYLRDKWRYIFEGYRLEAYLPGLLSAAPRADVIIFGHTHFPENRRIDGRLLFNPGSASLFWKNLPDKKPTYGILDIQPGRQVRAEIFELDGYMIRKGAWIRREDA